MDKSIQPIIAALRLKVLGIEGVPDSYSSEVYKLHLSGGETVYLKIPFNKHKWVREQRILQMLQGIMPVPEILDIWTGDDARPGALLLSAIPGTACPETPDRELAYQIGVLHATMHQQHMPEYGVHDADGFKALPHNDWRLYQQSNFADWQQVCRTILEPDLFEACLEYFAAAYAALPQPDGPCLIHMDFRPGNILVNGQAVTGLIDFESARSGAAEADFTKMSRYIWTGHPQAREHYAAGYEAVRPLPDLDRVLPFYQFYDAFSGVAWCERRGIAKNRAFLEENIAVLRNAVRPC